MFFFCMSKKQKNKIYIKKFLNLITEIESNAEARADLQELAAKNPEDRPAIGKQLLKLKMDYIKMRDEVIKLDKSKLLFCF